MKIFTRLIRPVALLLALIMTLGALAGCAASGDVVMELGGSKITANMLAFWLSRYKAFFVYYYMNNQEDDSMWSMAVDETGTTVNDLFTSYVVENAKTYVASLYLFDQYKLKLSDKAKADIEQTLAEIVDSTGSKSALNADLSNYAVNYDILKEIYTIEAKVERLQEYILSAEGPAPLTTAQMDEYYQKNYARISHIFIGTDSKFVYDEEGMYVYDEEGNVKTEEYTEEELAEQKRKAEEVVSKLEAGGDFDELLEKYTEDTA
ncbi:MAG: hypothetical protein IKL84_04925, partial [Clostridia bacterium]|nr:hypothetical protein [Clostridia bacterium]